MGWQQVDLAAALPSFDAAYPFRPFHNPMGISDLAPAYALQLWDAWAVDELRQGRLPLWQPHHALGLPLWSNGQASPFHPLKLLLVWGPSGPAYFGFLFSHLVVAAWGGLALGWRLTWAPLPSAMVGLAFALSAPMLGHLPFPNVNAWCALPGLLACALALGQKPGPRHAAALGLGTAWVGLAGHAEAALITAGGAWLMGLPAAWSSPLRAIWFKWAGVALALALAVSAPAWVGFLGALPHADSYLNQREHSTYAGLGEAWSLRVTLPVLVRHVLSPLAEPMPFAFNPYASWWGLLACPVLLALGRGLPRQLVCAAGLLFALALLLFQPTTPWPWLKPSPNSFYVVPYLSLALALSLGWALQTFQGKGWGALAGAGALLAGVLGLALGPAWGQAVQGWALLVGSASLALMLWAILGKATQGATQAWVVGSLLVEWAVLVALALPWNPPFAYPPPPGLAPSHLALAQGRLATGGLGFHPNLGHHFGWRQYDALEAWFPRRLLAYHDLAGSHSPGTWLLAQPEVVASGWLDLASVDHRLRRDLLGRLVAQPRPGALPRLRWLGQAEWASNWAQAKQRMQSAGPMWWRNRLLLEGVAQANPPHPPAHAAAPARLKWRLDDPGHLSIQSVGQADGWLLLADQWDPDWEAFLDGERVPLRPAYLTMRAVYLPSGQHEVVMRYAPKRLWWSLLAACLGLLGALWLWFPRSKAVGQASMEGCP